jgi:hypothetical protein
MKRFWITLLAVAMALVIALPAGAVKPVKPPKEKPPKPPTSVLIAVYLDAQPVWVHEARDLIHYKVTLENKTSADIDNVAVQFTTTDKDVYVDPVEHWDFPEGATDGAVPANSTVSANFYLYVDQFFEADPCLTEDENTWPAKCSLLATAKVLIDNEPTTQTQMSVPLMPDPLCVIDNGTATLTGGEVCIWNPPSSGEWTVLVTPEKPVTRPTRMMVSVRDGVPGNWFTDPEVAESGVIFRRLMPEDPVFKLQVLLPGSGGAALEGLADGQCNSGGAGGDYFAAGNPYSFYLYTSLDGTATFSQGSEG